MVTNLNNQILSPKHYSNFYSLEKPITFRVRTILKSGKYNDKYIIDILKIEDWNVSGKAMLNIAKDSMRPILSVDEIHMTTEALQGINGPVNPNQFDYKSYLEKQYVYDQIYTKRERLITMSNKKHTLFGYADLLRKAINAKLKRFDFTHNELAVINALILGQRQNIGKDIRTNYTNAGAIHILAVSGLHIGIIFFLLNAILYPLRYLKRGIPLQVGLIVLILWSFAIVAGLSASVTRAVTMFSIVAIGMHLKRPTNIYNTLASSILVLLLFKPMFLFDVGFQLSYLAVFSIVSIQPILARLWEPKYYIYKRFWEIVTVSISAQIGVIPVSLFYFHQFPGLFIISNIVIIPFLGMVLGFGLFIVALALIDCLPSFLANLYGKLIGLMNNFVEWIASQEHFLFKEISFNGLQVVFSYLMIIALVRFATKQTYKRTCFALIALVFFQTALIITKYNSNENCFTIFHKSKHTIIANKTNSKLQIYSSLDSLNQYKMLSNYKVANNVELVTTDTLQSIYSINSEHILLIDSLGIYNLETLKPKYVLLRNSPKINLKRMIDVLNPEYVIADGSNYKSYIRRWKASCEKEKLPFHYTGEKGAFTIVLD